MYKPQGGGWYQVGTYEIQQNSFWVQKIFGCDPGARRKNGVSRNVEFLNSDQNWSPKIKERAQFWPTVTQI